MKIKDLLSNFIEIDNDVAKINSDIEKLNAEDVRINSLMNDKVFLADFPRLTVETNDQPRIKEL